jgi:predicted kinase
VEFSDRKAPGGAVPTPGLLILTGASHTGKTSVAEAVLEAVDPPAAFLSVDNILEHTISRPPGDPWAQIPLAYELLEPQVGALLEHGWFVIVESTFTYVPENGASQFHREQLVQLIDIAERCNAPWLLIQLATTGATARGRAERTGRLPQKLVADTVQLHRNVTLPPDSLRIIADTSNPTEIAEQVLKTLANSGAG